MKPSKLITQLIAIVITVLAGVAFAAANNWTPPTGIAPAGNVDAPINTSGTAQEKLGGLILGSGLLPGHIALYLPTGNLFLGEEASIVVAPNGKGNNIDVNDIYIRSSRQWASALVAPAPAPAPTPPPTCTPTDWSPVVVPGNVCSGSIATQVKTNADCTTSAQSIGGTKDCSTPPAGPTYTPGEWFNDKLGFFYDQRDPDGNWATVQTASFVAPHTINKIRVRGVSDDGGYCYAYSTSGTGHAATVYQDGSAGVYNVDGQWYDGQPIYTSPTTVWDAPCINEDGTVVSNECPRIDCGGGTFMPGAGGDSGDPGYCVSGRSNTCPTNPPSFDDRGNAKICQWNWGNGPLAAVTENVNFPTGTTIILQGRHTIGNADDNITCALDIQYAP